MRPTYRYLLAGLLLAAGIGNLVQALSTPAGSPRLPGLWVTTVVWLGLAVLLLRRTPLARIWRGKQDAARVQRRQEALLALQAQGAMDAVLESCRAALGQPPRRFSRQELATLVSPKPAWCKAGTPMEGFFDAQERLLETGVVVWAHTVQANVSLFYPGPQNSMASTLFCVDPEERNVMSNLDGIARQLGESKGTVPEDPGERAIADYLTDEYMQAFGLPVPPGVSPWLRCAVSSLYVDRRHLPDAKLSLPFYPVVLNPTEPRYVMILPCRFWPDLLVRAWAG